MAKYHIYGRKKYEILLESDVRLFGNRAKKINFCIRQKSTDQVQQNQAEAMSIFIERECFKFSIYSIYRYQ